MRPAGLILAGGRGTRMGAGHPKPLRRLAGRPLVAHVADALSGSVAPLFLNTSDAEAYAFLGLPCVPDRRDGFLGPLAGIEAGLMALEERAGGPAQLLVVPGDTPFLPKDLAARLACSGSRPAIVRFRARPQPAVSLWPLSLRPRLSAWLDAARPLALMAFLDEATFEAVDIGEAPDAPGGDPFFNVNTPDDLALCEAHLAPS
ncbi:molybdenum cofactor guanylyltransferase [Aurantimonas sp. Leaf443]|uniref:molybdenum cofactor guanylyltransferase n=1 Tax=Aurantimonas sp. Leaf443 TaxID=1736378 RepID=UPI0006FB9A6F|nr:molybdenum cofactor guanylyltransferase [Aurantimonas sp. Leaf443]KQT86189.1 hypothetical protein ASG48_06350 [Aurantimonas sp. Leaf443]